ncbi:MAG: L-histidine N(alpha)-methyltransferase [Candidatus Eremiobacteraeota bacterium]|nr:L-histidine N(alpha)-methyltransferase [Candidatus Eremiobacteraeota bacterium]
MATFAEDVKAGLFSRPKRLPPKYFYDDVGSALFEAITHLPEYYLTRTESALLKQHAGDIVALLDGPLELLELGSGSASKTRLLIAAALERQETLRYSPIDISPGALIASSQALVEEYPALTVSAYAGDYVSLLEAGAVTRSGPVLALFLGSNIGNFEPVAAAALLRSLARALGAGDALLVGTDLKKGIERLERAYDDPTGVTAAFNRNVLARMNRELGADFDVRLFEHEAHYDPVRGSVDSFLVAQAPCTVHFAALGASASFAEREAIHTESSYKYAFDDIERFAAETGYSVRRQWTDGAEDYALSLLCVE